MERLEGPYEQLTIDQKISLKGIISRDSRYRDFLSQKEDHGWLDRLYIIRVVWDWRTAINFFLTEDISFLKM